MYFCDQDLEITMNHDEFTQYEWLSIDEILKQYEEGKLPVFHP